MSGKSEGWSRKEIVQLSVSVGASALTSVPAWADLLGIDQAWLGSWIGAAMKLLFPFAMLATGIVVGRFALARRMRRENITADRIAELEKERGALAARLADWEDIEAREAERRRRRLDGIAVKIKDLHANVKLVILALYDDGPIRDLHFHDFDGAASFLSDYADGEEIPPGNVIFTLKPETREALDAHPEALERVRERIEADPRLRLPLEPDGSPGMEGVLKVSDGYARTRSELSTPAVPEDGRIVPAPARTEQAD